MPTLFVESLANYSPNPIVRGGCRGAGEGIHYKGFALRIAFLSEHS